VLPVLGLTVVFSIVPLVMTLWFSFRRYNLLEPSQTGFAHLENYRYLLGDPSLGPAILNTFLLVGWVLVITVGLGTLLAVGYALGPTQVVIFGTARTVSRVALQMVAMVNNTFEPELSIAYGARNFELTRTLLRRACQLALVVAFVIVVAMMTVGPWFLTHWTGGHVPPNRRLLSILLVVVVFYALWSTSSTLMTSTNQHQKMAAIYLAATSLTCVACFYFWRNLENVALPDGWIHQDVFDESGDFAFFLGERGDGEFALGAGERDVEEAAFFLDVEVAGRQVFLHELDGEFEQRGTLLCGEASMIDAEKKDVRELEAFGAVDGHELDGVAGGFVVEADGAEAGLFEVVEVFEELGEGFSVALGLPGFEEFDELGDVAARAWGDKMRDFEPVDEAAKDVDGRATLEIFSLGGDELKEIG